MATPNGVKWDPEGTALVDGREPLCQCCRHYGPCPAGTGTDVDQGLPCRRCTQCGEWCEGCGTIVILGDDGLCDPCRAGMDPLGDPDD